jgi:hypothetical protein
MSAAPSFFSDGIPLPLIEGVLKSAPEHAIGALLVLGNRDLPARPAPSQVSAAFLSTLLALDARLVGMLKAAATAGAVGFRSEASDVSSGSSVGPSASAVGSGVGSSVGGVMASTRDPLHHQKKARDALLKHVMRTAQWEGPADPGNPLRNLSKFKGVWRKGVGEWTVKVTDFEKSFPTMAAAESAFLKHARDKGVTEQSLLWRDGYTEEAALKTAKRPRTS